MDGRVQEPVARFLKKKFRVDHVDMITEPGPDKILARNRKKPAIASIKGRVKISTQKHGSKVIAVAGHHDCAGHSVNKARHTEDIMRSVANITQWGLASTVLGLWVNRNGHVEEIVRVADKI